MEQIADEFLDVSLLDLEGDVEEQVAKLLEHVRLSRGDVICLRKLLSDLELTLRTTWPKCEVFPFGSIITGLGIKTSDVDVYVKIPNSTTHKINPVIVTRNILRISPWRYAEVFAIPSAKVPIVKFYHIPTGCYCDVNFKSESGVRNSKLIFKLLQTDSKALSLAILVKYWSKVFNLTGTNLLSSYALTLLVIFYLQGIKMLAPVYDLQKSVGPYMVDGWNCALDKTACHPKAYRDNIYHLFGGFFKYYSFFRFDQYVISPYLGTPALRSIFGGPDHLLHKEFSMYYKNLASGFCKPLRIDALMCIQDPYEHSRNCAVGVSQKLFTKIQVHLQYAARMYDQMPPDDFLKAVFRQDALCSTRVFIENPHKHVIKTIFKKNNKKKKKKMNNLAMQYVQMQKK